MPKILITAFKPFGTLEENISEELLKEFMASDVYEKLPEDVEVVFKVLDVDEQKLDEYGQMIRDVNPDYVLSMGYWEKSNTPGACTEAAAFNVYVDLSTDFPERKNVEENAPGVQFGINSQDITRSLMKEHAFLGYSYHTDFGMCNSVYYKFIHEMEALGKDNRVMFLHLNGPETSELKPVFLNKYNELLESTIMAFNELDSCSECIEQLGLVHDDVFQEAFIPQSDTTSRKTFNVHLNSVPKLD